MTTLSAHEPAATAAAAGVSAAIDRAVRAGLGVSAVTDTAVTALEFQVLQPAGAELDAVPAPGARLGHRMPFTLVDRRLRRRVGWASAHVEVEARYLRAAAFIRRGEPLASAAVVPETGRLPAMPVVRIDLHAPDASAARDIRPGEILTARLAAPVPAVRRGETVTVATTAGLARISLSGTAVESGAVGEIIRVTNRESGREIKARVTGQGEAEVVR